MDSENDIVLSSDNEMDRDSNTDRKDIAYQQTFQRLRAKLKNKSANQKKDDDGSLEAGKMAMSCLDCSKKFKDMSELREHICKNDPTKESQGLIKSCNVCPFTTDGIRSFKMHLRTHEEVKKPFSCKTCPEKFSARTLLYIHSRHCKKKEKPEQKPSPNHPPYIAMVKKAIASNISRKGTSTQTIIKYIIDNYNVDHDRVSFYVISTLRKYTSTGDLMRVGEGYGANCTYKLARDREHSDIA